jgi:hypothetical protein
MKLSTLIIGLVIISTMFIGMYSFATSVAGGYGVSVDQTYANQFNKTNTLNNQLNDSFSRVNQLSANTGSTIQIITLVPDVLIILRDMVSLPFTALSEFITGFSGVLGLPVWVSTFALTIFTIIILFAIIAAILGRDA